MKKNYISYWLVIAGMTLLFIGFMLEAAHCQHLPVKHMCGQLFESEQIVLHEGDTMFFDTETYIEEIVGFAGNGWYEYVSENEHAKMYGRYYSLSLAMSWANMVTDEFGAIMYMDEWWKRSNPRMHWIATYDMEMTVNVVRPIINRP